MTGIADGTMFVALHGALTPHPWRDPVVDTSDAYSLFVARASAMGWLADPVGDGRGGVWGMNDAGQDPPRGSPTSRVAWFQVSVPVPLPAGRPLPVQAFLSCAGDALSRIGRLRLQAVQLLLPLQGLDPSTGRPPGGAVMTLLQDAGWFADGDPDRRTSVQVTIDGGQDPTIRGAAPGMLGWMQDLRQDVFSADSFALTDDDEMALEPAVIDELWRGPAQHRVSFRGSLADWSLDALGWLAAFLADTGARHGVNTPVMLTARPAESPHHTVD